MRGCLPILAAVVTGCLYDARLADSPDAAHDAAVDASTLPRITDGLIGLWLFDDGAGTIVSDTAGVDPPVSPTIATAASVTWAPGTLAVTAPVDINTGFATNRLVAAVRDSSELTVEAWVTPASASQTGTVAGQPARIVSITVANIGTHYLGLGQLDTTWAAQVKTDAMGVGSHGGPNLVNGTVAAGTLTHLVVTSDATHRRLYVDGVMVEDAKGGSLAAWKPERTFALAGDPGGRNTWLGTLHLVAMYDRALTADEVATNLRAGP